MSSPKIRGVLDEQSQDKKNGELDILDVETILQPDEYELPSWLAASYTATHEKLKMPIRVTRRQIQYFGEQGTPWIDVEKFYGCDRVTLMRYFKMDYERGFAKVNGLLRAKQIQTALAGDKTMLIWLGKNRLGQSDAGPTEKIVETNEGVAWKSEAPPIPNFNDADV